MTRLPLQKVNHPLSLPKRALWILTQLSPSHWLLPPNWLNPQNWLIFIYILKFSISLVWCHLSKLLRHLIMIITRVPSFHHVFILPQSNLWQDMNLFHLHLAFLSRDDWFPLSCSLVHVLDLSNLTYISSQKV